jgi:hypothetical protein
MAKQGKDRFYKKRLCRSYTSREATSPGTEKDVQELLRDNLTVVLFDRYFPDLSTNYVVVDNSGSTYNAI